MFTDFKLANSLGLCSWFLSLIHFCNSYSFDNLLQIHHEGIKGRRQSYGQVARECSLVSSSYHWSRWRWRQLWPQIWRRFWRRICRKTCDGMCTKLGKWWRVFLWVWASHSRIFCLWKTDCLLHQDKTTLLISYVVTLLWQGHPVAMWWIYFHLFVALVTGYKTKYISVPPWFLHSVYFVIVYLVGAHVVTVQLPTRCLVATFLHQPEGSTWCCVCDL